MESSAQGPPSPPPAQPPAGEPPSGDYPVRLEADREPEYNRFLPLVKWLLAFPHYLVLIVVGIAAFFAILISFFAVLITGRYPRGLWDFVTGTHRWGMRVAGYVLLLTDQYPPFSLQNDPSYPVRVEWDYPETVDRWRPLVHWLLIIPYALVAGVLIWLAEIVAFIGVFVILFTKDLPEGMFRLIVNPMRWQVRANSYYTWLVTRYPPFEWEE
jgi:Domain of unknown function (DUF4389)